MKINLIVIGKTHKKFLVEGEAEYFKRIKRYCKTEIIVIPDIKNAKNKSEDQLKEEEGNLILSKIENADFTVLLDEKGEQFTSVQFSRWIQKEMNKGPKKINFIVGGPYGFSEKVYQKANAKISLSKMTFSHQMIRMLFLEQLYRAFSILKNEPYHHE